MRMRKKKHGEQRLLNCAGLWIEQPAIHKGKWAELFGRQAPIHIEIGCGKGGFMAQMAQNNPHINYIAMEQNMDVLVLAVEKAKELGLTNVKYLLCNAAYLLDVFAPEECSRIYLNFSDPWHKKRHHKRRLTAKTYLDLYRTILQPDGEIHMKTDNVALFDYSVESFEQNGFALNNVTYDLHHSTFEGNIMTEYETLFASQGKPICRLEATFAE